MIKDTWPFPFLQVQNSRDAREVLISGIIDCQTLTVWMTKYITHPSSLFLDISHIRTELPYFRRNWGKFKVHLTSLSSVNWVQLGSTTVWACLPLCSVLFSAWHFCTWNIPRESFRDETFIASVVGAASHNLQLFSHSVFTACSFPAVEAITNEHCLPWRRMSFITHSITLKVFFLFRHISDSVVTYWIHIRHQSFMPQVELMN